MPEINDLGIGKKVSLPLYLSPSTIQSTLLQNLSLKQNLTKRHCPSHPRGMQCLPPKDILLERKDDPRQPPQFPKEERHSLASW